MPAHLLLVGLEAERLAALCARAGLVATPVASAAAARAYLSGGAFDAVAVQAEMGEELAELAAGLGVPRVCSYASDADLAAWADAAFGQADAPRSADSPVVPVPPDVPPDAVREALVALRAEIVRVAHDLANPLAVVMGTAQLGRETAGDAETEQAFADIEVAAGLLAERLADLAALRLRLDALVGPGA